MSNADMQQFFENGDQCVMPPRADVKFDAKEYYHDDNKLRSAKLLFN